jgi:hypothetical protein
MTHSRKIGGVQLIREKIQLVDLQAEVARLYLCVVLHVERDDAFDQGCEVLSVTKNAEIMSHSPLNTVQDTNVLHIRE